MLQYIITFIILGIAIYWAVRRIIFSFSGKQHRCDGCDGCPFKEKRTKNNCSKRKKYIS